jgi:O-antigen/teichoic acid export membrane protein
MEVLINRGYRLLDQFRRVAGVARLRPFDTSTVEGRSKERYRRILLTTSSNLAVRALSSIVGLVTIPLALSYLGKEKYGLWAVVTSFVAWGGLFNFGIINSLVNALSEANGKNNPKDAKSYVSTAFFALLAISTTLGIVVLLCAGWVPWFWILAVRIPIAQQTVMWTVLVALFCVLASLPLSITGQIYAGYQKSYMVNIFSTLGALTTLAALYVVVWTKGGLPALVFAFSGPGVLIGIINLLYLTHKEMPWIAPQLRCVSRQAMRRLSKTSTPLFLFQIGVLLINETQMIVLAHVTSLKLVSEYSIVLRFGITLSSFVGLGTGAFVPAFREAHERGDSGWMKAAFRRMLLLRMSIAAAVAFTLILGGNFILRVWLHRGDFNSPASVWIVLSVSLVSAIWGSSFAEFLIIMDRIWIQVAMVLINGIVTIGLTVVLAPRYGLLGALISSGFVTVCFWTWVIPLLARPIIAMNSSGTSGRKMVQSEISA